MQRIPHSVGTSTQLRILWQETKHEGLERHRRTNSKTKGKTEEKTQSKRLLSRKKRRDVGTKGQGRGTEETVGGKEIPEQKSRNESSVKSYIWKRRRFRLQTSALQNYLLSLKAHTVNLRANAATNFGCYTIASVIIDSVTAETHTAIHASQSNSFSERRFRQLMATTSISIEKRHIFQRSHDRTPHLTQQIRKTFYSQRNMAPCKPIRSNIYKHCVKTHRYRRRQHCYPRKRNEE